MPASKRYRLDPEARARLIDAYSPGARVLRIRHLPGGLDAVTQALNLEYAGGIREKVLLRVYPPGRQHLTPETAQREFRAIALMRSAGVPAARPLFLDAGGMYLGTPAMVLSYVPGRTMYVRGDVDAKLGELARVMQAMHKIKPERFDLSWLPRFGRAETARELHQWRLTSDDFDDPLAGEVYNVLETALDRVAWPDACLIHDDFWPGNTVWMRGRLTGVIDWSDVALGDPRRDLSQCRIDILLAYGEEASDALVSEYGSLTGTPFPDLWFTDLLKGLRAFLQYRVWIEGFGDVGLGHVTEELARECLTGFLRRGLRAASRAGLP